MKNKKKSLPTDHILPEVNFKNNRFYPGPNMHAPNNYKAAIILPDGYRAACHLHKEVMLFKTLEEAAKHMRDVHMVWKG